MSSIKASNDVATLRKRYLETKQTTDNRATLLDDLFQKVSDMQKTMDRNPFILVLIDGDCMQFLDHFVQQGIPGGDAAAKGLQKAIFDYLRHEEDFAHDTKIVVRVYANLTGLSNTYVSKRILTSATIFTEFVLGFNKSNPLCDFVDAGNHKEAADSKLKEILKIHIYDVHCKQIVFGAPTDNGYASFLSSFLIDPEIPSRVRVLKGRPFTAEWREILPKFRHTELKEIFRSDDLIAVRNNRKPGDNSPMVSEKRKHTNDDCQSPRKQRKLRTRQSLPVLNQKPSSNLNDKTQVAASISGTAQEECIEVGITADEVKAALQDSSVEYLPIAPSIPDFDLVLRRTEEKLGLTSDFWEHHDWKSRSNTIIQEAIDVRKLRANELASRPAT